MKFDRLNYSLLARYLAGDCTSREHEVFEQWMNEDPVNRKEIEEFRRIWEASARKKDLPEADVNIEMEWDKLKSRLRREGEYRHDSDKPADYADKSIAASVHSAPRQILRVAAILLIAGLIGLFSYRYWPDTRTEPVKQVFREISTEKAQRANTVLGDGTRVLLNAESKMRLPSEFTSDVREVYLEGEAFFNVSANPEKPFIIHSRGAVIRVLGTSFAVRSYPEEKEVRVVVQEGRVSLEAERSRTARKTTLKANELGRYSLQSKEIKTRQVNDMQLYLSWKEGYLKFRKTPMHRVATALERRYGVEVSFRHPEMKEMLLTALLKSRSIRNVLDVIAVSLNIEYRMEENSVIFYRE